MLKRQSFGQRHKYGVRRTIAGAAALTTAGLLGAGVESIKSNYDANVLNRNQPTCAIEPTDHITSVQDVRNLISSAGDNVQHERASVWTPNGDGSIRQREYGTDPVINAGTDHASLIVNVHDQIRIDHVNPNVCKAVGGFVIENSNQNGANFRASNLNQ